MVVSNPPLNGGGYHGHIEMITKNYVHKLFKWGACFTIPTNPGPYPTMVDSDPLIHEQQVVEHKAEIAEFKTYLGIKNALCQKIVKAVNEE